MSTRVRFLLSVFVLALGLCGVACKQDPKVARQRYMDSADKFVKSGKYAEAIVEYKNALQQDPLSGEAYAKLADAYLATQDLSNALGAFVRAADLLPDDVQIQMKAGSLLLLGGRFDDARARAAKVIEKDSRNIEAQVLLANALAGLRDVEGALAQIEDALRVDPNRSGTYTSLGSLELSRGQRDTAEAAFKKAVELEPRSLQANLALANFYWLTGQPARAEESLKRALDLDPLHPLTNRALASFYMANGRPADAEKPLKTVAEVSKSPASVLTLADYYLGVGNDAAVRATLEPLLKDPKSFNEATARLAALDFRSGKRDTAYRGVDGVLAKDKTNLDGLLLKTSFLLADRKLDEALQSATTATERHPDSSSAFFTLGRVQAARKQPDEATAAFQEVLRLNPQATEAKIALSQLSLSQGRPEASVAFAREALADKPNNADAQLALVRALVTNGELDRAEAELKRLNSRFPDSAAVHTQMGMLLGRKQQSAAARTEFDRALKLEPGNVEALSGLVTLDLASKDFKSAQARVDAQIAVRPTSGLMALGARAYAAGGDLSKAETYLRRAIELDSRDLAAYSGLGQLYLAQKKLDQARKEFEALAAREPRSVAALTMVGIILQAQGDAKGARERFERVVEIDPQAAVAANNLAWMYAESGGNLDKALQLAQAAHKQLPDLPEVNDTLGFVYYKKNLAALAIPPFKVSVEKNPGNPVYHYHLGLAYASAGDSARAKQSLTRALALQPNFEGADETRRLLNSIR